MDDTDLAGPLVFCLAFGGFLLLVRESNIILLDNNTYVSGFSIRFSVGGKGKNLWQRCDL